MAEPLASAQAADDEEKRNILRNDCGGGDTVDAHVADDDKKEVQARIHNAGDSQKDHGALRVSERAQKGGAEVIHDRSGNADKIDAKVQARERQHVLRRFHELE